jgi:hypothetical protein
VAVTPTLASTAACPEDQVVVVEPSALPGRSAGFQVSPGAPSQLEVIAAPSSLRAGDLLNVSTDIANFRELGCLDLDKRRIRKFGEAARYLGLAAPRGANHQNVFGRHFIAQIRAETLATPAIAQRNRDRTFRVRLANNMFVESSHNGFGCQSVFHYCLDGKLLVPFKSLPRYAALSNVSTVSWSLV